MPKQSGPLRTTGDLRHFSHISMRLAMLQKGTLHQPRSWEKEGVGQLEITHEGHVVRDKPLLL